MHRSRIGVILIDHPRELYEEAAKFWSAATGEERNKPDEDEPYEELGELGAGIKLDLQRTDSGTLPRVHLDIETDDVEAETARLINAGATVLEEREGYRILTDPGGLVFCVVPVQTTDFESTARSWD